ncbi:FlgB family protein [Ruegeria sp. SCPT10]|uniref:FlgB family protein n=1 Tax=Ruegeria sp. SCP10 TaxID=3141377 RepID=UPI003334D0AB
MFYDLNVFKTAHAMATHAGQRQAVIARNMANADTPGYQPRDIEAFKSAFENTGPQTQMMATRRGHLNGGGLAGHSWAEFAADPSGDPNGNGVSLEEEMLKAVDVKRQHDRALVIYKSSMNVLRTSLGRG